MTERAARKKLEWIFKRNTSTKKIFLQYILPGIILILFSIVAKFIFSKMLPFSILYLIGQFFMFTPSIKDLLANKASTYDFKEKWISDRWIKVPNGNFLYFCSYEFSLIDKVYDIYRYNRKMLLTDDYSGFQYSDEWEFKLVDQNGIIDRYDTWRFVTKEEIEEHNLDAYTAKILLQKEDDKYTKISK